VVKFSVYFCDFILRMGYGNDSCKIIPQAWLSTWYYYEFFNCFQSLLLCL